MKEAARAKMHELFNGGYERNAALDDAMRERCGRPRQGSRMARARIGCRGRRDGHSEMIKMTRTGGREVDGARWGHGKGHVSGSQRNRRRLTTNLRRAKTTATEADQEIRHNDIPERLQVGIRCLDGVRGRQGRQGSGATARGSLVAAQMATQLPDIESIRFANRGGLEKAIGGVLQLFKGPSYFEVPFISSSKSCSPTQARRGALVESV